MIFVVFVYQARFNGWYPVVAKPLSNIILQGDLSFEYLRFWKQIK